MSLGSRPVGGKSSASFFILDVTLSKNRRGEWFLPPLSHGNTREPLLLAASNMDDGLDTDSTDGTKEPNNARTPMAML
jgi:hypothetical protein